VPSPEQQHTLLARHFALFYQFCLFHLFFHKTALAVLLLLSVDITTFRSSCAIASGKLNQKLEANNIDKSENLAQYFISKQENFSSLASNL
jgi:hypothetical protein